jgi:hypothetical protein
VIPGKSFAPYQVLNFEVDKSEEIAKNFRKGGVNSVGLSIRSSDYYSLDDDEEI